MAAFRPGVAAIAEVAGRTDRHRLRRRHGRGHAKAAIDAGVPAALAARAAAWPYLHTAFDIVEVAGRGAARPRTRRGSTGVCSSGSTWPGSGSASALLPRSDRWQAHARAALRDDLLGELRTLADDALRAGDVFTPVDGVLERWMAANERAVVRAARLFEQIRAGGVFDLTTLSVALRQLRNLVLASNPTERAGSHADRVTSGCGFRVSA